MGGRRNANHLLLQENCTLITHSPFFVFKIYLAFSEKNADPPRAVLSTTSNSKSSSSRTDQADHDADQAGQVQIRRDKCISSRSSGSCRREPDQIIYYNL